MSENDHNISDLNGNALELVLYSSSRCIFCLRVHQVLQGLGLEIPIVDINAKPENRRQLIELGGKSQVPMLLINGAPLYESRDIIDFLNHRILL